MIRATLPALIAAFTLSGCYSLMAVRGPSPGLYCTERMGLPVVDGVFAGLYAIGSFRVAGEGFDHGATLMRVGAGIHTLSGAIGFRNVRNCRAAKLRWLQPLPRDTIALPWLTSDPRLEVTPKGVLRRGIRRTDDADWLKLVERTF